MSGWSQILSTASLAPFTILNTPSGSPASFKYSAILNVDNGVCSDGFKMKQFPVVNASGIIQRGTIAGKLKGVIPATTPKGSWVMVHVIPGPTGEESPLNMLGKEVANSTTSFPRRMLPFASEIVFPLSKAINSAISSKLFSMMDFRLNITSALSRTFKDAHAGKAAFAC